MPDVTRLLDAAGDRRAATDLLPPAYDERRRLAAQRLAAGKAGQALEPTALAHEASLRHIDPGGGPDCNGRGHFGAAVGK